MKMKKPTVGNGDPMNFFLFPDIMSRFLEALRRRVVRGSANGA